MADQDIAIKYGGGYIGAFGPRIDAIANEIVGTTTIATPQTSPYHITLLSKNEIRQITTDGSINLDELTENASRVDTRAIFSLGLGGDPKNVCWIVMIWNAGNMFRKKYGLPCKQFHITLTDVDDHGIDKGLPSLRDPSALSNLNVTQMDHLVLACNLNDQYDLTYMYAREMCQRFPQSEKGWLRLGDVARRNEQYKLAMLAFAQTIQLIPDQGQEGKIQDYCTKKIFHCAAHHTEWGCLFGENDLEQIPEELRVHLFTPWPQTLRQRLMNAFANDQPQMTQISRIHILVPYTDPRHPAAAPGRSIFSLLFKTHLHFD